MERSRNFIFLALLILGFVASARGQDAFPDKPIRLIAGTIAGGPTDILARVLAARLGKTMSATIVVENKAGASGTIAGGEVARAKPDGYTLQMGTTSANVLPALLKLKPPFDPVKDFTPVSVVGAVPLVAYINPSLPAKNLKEFVELAKPGKFSYGSAGVGTTSNLSGELLRLLNGNFELTHVPYRGAPAMDQAVIAGEIQIGFNTVGGVAELHKAGRVRALAVLGGRRSELMPDVPSADESGMKELRGVVSFYLLAPRALPKKTLAKLNGAVADALADPKFLAELRKLGIEPEPPNSPQAAAQYVRDEVSRWQRVVDAARIPLE